MRFTSYSDYSLHFLMHPALRPDHLTTLDGYALADLVSRRREPLLNLVVTP